MGQRRLQYSHCACVSILRECNEARERTNRLAVVSRSSAAAIPVDGGDVIPQPERARLPSHLRSRPRTTTAGFSFRNRRSSGEESDGNVGQVETAVTIAVWARELEDKRGRRKEIVSLRRRTRVGRVLESQLDPDSLDVGEGLTQRLGARAPAASELTALLERGLSRPRSESHTGGSGE